MFQRFLECTASSYEQLLPIVQIGFNHKFRSYPKSAVTCIRDHKQFQHWAKTEQKNKPPKILVINCSTKRNNFILDCASLLQQPLVLWINHNEEFTMDVIIFLDKLYYSENTTLVSSQSALSAHSCASSKGQEQAKCMEKFLVISSYIFVLIRVKSGLGFYGLGLNFSRISFCKVPNRIRSTKELKFTFFIDISAQLFRCLPHFFHSDP